MVDAVAVRPILSPPPSFFSPRGVSTPTLREVGPGPLFCSSGGLFKKNMASMFPFPGYEFLGFFPKRTVIFPPQALLPSKSEIKYNIYLFSNSARFRSVLNSVTIRIPGDSGRCHTIPVSGRKNCVFPLNRVLSLFFFCNIPDNCDNCHICDCRCLFLCLSSINRTPDFDRPSSSWWPSPPTSRAWRPLPPPPPRRTGGWCAGGPARPLPNPSRELGSL